MNFVFITDKENSGASTYYKFWISLQSKSSLCPGATVRKTAESLYVPHALQAHASQIVKPQHWWHENEKAVPVPDVIFDYHRLWVQTPTGKRMLVAFPITVHHHHHGRLQWASCSVCCVSLMVTDPGSSTPYTQGLHFFTSVEISRQITSFFTASCSDKWRLCPEFTKTSQELSIRPILDITLDSFHVSNALL
jgi:hypothetical protein